MSTTFFMAPFDPSTWSQPADSVERTTSDLYLDPVDYRDAMCRRWADASISFNCEACSLEFELPLVSAEYAGLRGCLQSNLQVVDFDTAPQKSFVDFILWHRAYVPKDFPLYLFNAASWDSLLLTRQTTGVDVIEFARIIA